MSIQAIVTDIEGTTTSLSFVKDVLFPYADQHMERFIKTHVDQTEVQALMVDTCELALLESSSKNAAADTPSPSCDVNDLDSVVTQLRAWIAADKKATPLKALQGLLWAEGYQRGDFTGHVYADAVQALKQWHHDGMQLAVYSSGSVQAQKLLFSYSDAGDLSPLFNAYFDTNIGHKREPSAYQRIAAELDLAPTTILFLSDIKEELDAAAEAGFKTCCVVRENQSIDGLEHRWVKDFSAIHLN